MGDEQVGTAVVGGGQAGLAVGYFLKQRRHRFVILDANARIGDSWRRRWDSLRLFTPGRYSGLPGMPFPGSPSAYPNRDQVADFLESYANRFQFPVRSGVKVERLARAGTQFELMAGERRFVADNVVVATGAYHDARVPTFASDLDPRIVQLHSSEYRNPMQIQKGPVLVVGAGNSGAEIALELSRDHQTWLSGRDTGHEPTRSGTIPDRFATPIIWLLATRVLTVDRRIGRKVRDYFLDPPRGIPLGRIRNTDFAAAGIERVPRVAGVRNGLPVLDDGRELDASSVVWCTGFTPNFAWIDLDLRTRYGAPLNNRGVVNACPGLYFVGLPFLYSLSSPLIGGVGRDAEHIVDHIDAVGRSSL